MIAHRTIALALVAAATLSLGATAPAFAAGGNGRACLSDQEIQSDIANGKIRRWAEIRRLAGVPDDFYETSGIQVCLRGGVPFFTVNMSSPKGDKLKIVRNAVDGSG